MVVGVSPRLISTLRAQHGTSTTGRAYFGTRQFAPSPPSTRKAILSITSPRGGSHVATLCPAVTATVADVKQSVEEVCGVPVRRQQLTLDGRTLSDSETLASLEFPTVVRLEQLEFEDRTPGAGQLYIAVEAGDDARYHVFSELLRAVGATVAEDYRDAPWVVYCSTRVRAVDLGERLRAAGRAAAELHGDLPEGKRGQILSALVSGDLQILVLTDAVAPRFLRDTQRPPIVLNYDFPTNIEDYGRRVFRTGFFSRETLAISLVPPERKRHLADVERFYSVAVQELPMDTRQLHLLEYHLQAASRGVRDGPAGQFHHTVVSRRPLEV